MEFKQYYFNSIFIFLISLFVSFQINATKFYKYVFQRDYQCLYCLVQQDYCERPDKKLIGGNTNELINCIKQQRIPIIVTFPILYNFVKRKISFDDPKHPENKFLQEISFSSKRWMLFFVPDTQFFVLIPKKNAKQLQRLFKLKESKFKPIPLNEEGAYEELIGFIEKKKKKKKGRTFDVIDLEKIFKVKSLPPLFEMKERDNGKAYQCKKLSQEELFWQKNLEYEAAFPKLIVVFSGHGNTDSLAGVHKSKWRKIINFFNTQVDTALMFIATCNAFSHVEMLQSFKRNFILMIQGINNRTCDCLRDMDLADFADLAKKVVKKECNIEALHKLIVHSIDSEGSATDSEDSATYLKNFMTTLLPNDSQFRIGTHVDDAVRKIDDVVLAVHKKEKEPIILWPYHSECKILKEQNIAKHLRSKAYCSFVIFSSPYIDSSLWVTRNPHSDPKKFPTFAALGNGRREMNFSYIKIFTRFCDFKNDGYGGIMEFICHAFLDGREDCEYGETYLIDQVLAYNDMYRMFDFKYSRDLDDLKRILGLYGCSNRINFYNVNVETGGTNFLTFVIRFELDKKAWQIKGKKKNGLIGKCTVSRLILSRYKNYCKVLRKRCMNKATH